VGNYGSGTVSVIDTANGTGGAAVNVGGAPGRMVMSPDGRRLYVPGTYVHAMSVIDTVTNSVAVISWGAATSSNSMAIFPDGRRAYISDEDADAIWMIDTATGAALGNPIHVAHPSAVAISSDGRRAYVANSGSNTVSVTDTDTGAIVGSPLAVGESPSNVAVSPDGGSVYVLNYKTVSVIDTAKNITVLSIPLSDRATDMTVAPDGGRLFVTHRDTDALSVIKL
jgi:YVTN family beta-propeller protein